MNKSVLFMAIVAVMAFESTIVKAQDAVAPVAAAEVVLEDGTKVSVEGDSVYVVAADGTKTAAPDGEHMSKDGAIIVTKDGKIVK